MVHKGLCLCHNMICKHSCPCQKRGGGRRGGSSCKSFIALLYPLENKRVSEDSKLPAEHDFQTSSCTPSLVISLPPRHQVFTAPCSQRHWPTCTAYPSRCLWVSQVLGMSLVCHPTWIPQPSNHHGPVICSAQCCCQKLKDQASLRCCCLYLEYKGQHMWISPMGMPQAV